MNDRHTCTLVQYAYEHRQSRRKTDRGRVREMWSFSSPIPVLTKKKHFKPGNTQECCRCFPLLLNFPITYPFSLNRTEKKESNRRRGRFKDRKGKCDWSKGRCVWPSSQLYPPSPALLQPIDPAVLPKSGWWRTLSASVLQCEKREWVGGAGDYNCTGSSGQVSESGNTDSNLPKLRFQGQV